MAILKDIEVRVVTKADEQPLPEYDKPGSDAATDVNLVEKYIEAKNGEDFQVEVYIKEDYDFYEAWGIRIWIRIDGGVVSFGKPCSKSFIAMLQVQEKPVLFDSVRQVKSGQHSRIGFRFGSLNLNENIDLPPSVVEKQSTNLGVIEVTVERVGCIQRSKPIERGTNYKPMEMLEGSKELIKEKHISSVMQPGVRTPESAPRLVHYSYPSYQREVCKLVRFLFRYRSEMELMLLGCIPRSPMPNAPPSMEEEVLIIPDEENQSPVASNRAPIGVKDETEQRADQEDLTASGDADRIDNHNALAEENQILKQRLKELQETQAKMMQAYIGGVDAMQSALASVVPKQAAPATSSATYIKRERIKEEDDAGPSGPSPRSAARSAKRTKTAMIELD